MTRVAGATASMRAGTDGDDNAHQWQAGVGAAVAAAERVLDVATETRLLLRACAPASPRGARVGVDTSPGLLAVAARALPTACFLRAHPAQLPFGEHTFDVATCIAAVHPAAVLPQWHRVLRAGGRLVISVPADHGLTAFALLRDAARDAGVLLAHPNAGLGTRPALDHLGHHHGFALQEVTAATYQQPLTGDADDAIDHYLNQGLAEPLRRADPVVQVHVLELYRGAYADAGHAGVGVQHLLFATWTTT